MLNYLESIILAGEENMRLLARSGNSVLQVFQKITAQLAGFEIFRGPASAMKRTAETLTGANESMFFGRDVLMLTIEQSVNGMENALNATSQVSRFSIVGPDMLNLVEDGCKQLETGLINVRKSDEKLFASTAKTVKQLTEPPENPREDSQPQPAAN